MVDINKVFEASEALLQARLLAIRSAFQHAGLKGASVENAIKELLQENLPDNIAIGSGIVIDSDYKSSRQLDIILYDRAKTPRLFGSNEMQIIPVECVYFVIEVKTSMNSSAFEECVQNMDSVKSLTRSAYYFDEPAAVIQSKTLYDGQPTRTWDTIFLVIALDSSVSPEIQLKYFENHRSTGRNIKNQIDSMFVLGSGTYTNYELIPQSNLKPNLTPSDNSLPCLMRDEALLGFFALFSRYFNQAEIGANFDFTKYIRFSKSVCVGNNSDRSKLILENARSDGYIFKTVG